MAYDKCVYQPPNHHHTTIAGNISGNWPRPQVPPFSVAEEHGDKAKWELSGPNIIIAMKHYCAKPSVHIAWLHALHV